MFPVYKTMLVMLHLLVPAARLPVLSGDCQPLVRRESSHHVGHLVVCVYPESPLLGDARQLHVLGVKFLLHDLLKCLEHQRLGIRDGERL
jgi:hypothetical protein